MRTKIFVLITILVSNYMLEQNKLIEEEVMIKNEAIELPGTLSYTKSSKKLIIWVHGSGNVDRNGNQGAIVKANYIKQFRDLINKESIAFFSYDKRTANPKNAAYLKGVVFDDFVNDLKKVIAHFKKEGNFKEIVLIGHSQGSLIAMLASNEVDKCISLAGPSLSIDKTITGQVSKQSAELGKTTASYFKELKETGDIKEVNPMLMSIFAKPNFPFLRNWMSYDPVEEIKKVKIPTLIINGTKDIQVSVNDAKALHKASKDTQLKIIENMNHVLKNIVNDADNMKSYYSAYFSISAELIKSVSDFIKQ